MRLYYTLRHAHLSICTVTSKTENDSQKLGGDVIHIRSNWQSNSEGQQHIVSAIEATLSSYYHTRLLCSLPFPWWSQLMYILNMEILRDFQSKICTSLLSYVVPSYNHSAIKDTCCNVNMTGIHSRPWRENWRQTVMCVEWKLSSTKAGPYQRVSDPVNCNDTADKG